MEDQTLSINRRSLLILLLGFFWLLVWHHFSQLDGRFFQPSLNGIKGLVWYEIGDYTRAADAYRAHLRAASLNLLEMGDVTAARQQAERALTGNPRDVDALLDLAELSIEGGQLEQAQGYLARVLDVRVDHYDALLLSAVAHARAKRYGEAVNALNRALRHGLIENRPTSFLWMLRVTGELTDLPKQERPACMLAYAHRYLRIFDESHARVAKSWAAQAIRAGDHADDAYVTLGVIDDKEGDQEKALDEFQKALEVNPGNIYARTTAARLYSERGDLTSEYQMLKGAYEHAPTDGYVVSAYSHLLSEKLADYRQALTVAQAAVDRDPDNPELLSAAAYLYKFMGDHARALEYYKQTVAQDPTNAEAHEMIAHILGFALGKQDEAIEVYHTALALDPSRSGIYTGLGSLYSYKGDVRQAITFYELAFQHGAQTTGDMLSLCSIYFKAGEFQKTADCTNRVLALNPNDLGAAKIRSFAVQNLPAAKAS